MNIIPIELYQIIFNYADFITKTRLTHLSKYYHKHLLITNLYDIDMEYIEKLTITYYKTIQIL